MRTRLALATITALAAGAVVSTSADAAPDSGSAGRVGHRVGHRVDPGDFGSPRPNTYFPLRPSTVFRYRGSEDGERFKEIVTITHRTRQIEGVRARVVRDVLRRADRSLAEKTFDWYAADDAGTVWYFGERTATYDAHGHLQSREGSWRAGVGGAVAGVIMPADPRPTDAYRQEFDRGNAEDQAWIVQRGFSTRVAYGRVHDVVRSLEWSRLEKNVVSLKLYAPHLGIVRERDLAGGSESFELVSVRRR